MDEDLPDAYDAPSSQGSPSSTRAEMWDEKDMDGRSVGEAYKDHEGDGLDARSEWGVQRREIRGDGLGSDFGTGTLPRTPNPNIPRGHLQRTTHRHHENVQVPVEPHPQRAPNHRIQSETNHYELETESGYERQSTFASTHISSFLTPARTTSSWIPTISPRPITPAQPITPARPMLDSFQLPPLAFGDSPIRLPIQPTSTVTTSFLVKEKEQLIEGLKRDLEQANKSLATLAISLREARSQAAATTINLVRPNQEQGRKIEDLRSKLKSETELRKQLERSIESTKQTQAQAQANLTESYKQVSQLQTELDLVRADLETATAQSQTDQEKMVVRYTRAVTRAEDAERMRDQAESTIVAQLEAMNKEWERTLAAV